MSGPELCQRLAWDSAFFGLAIGRIGPTRVDAAAMAQAMRCAAEQQLDCLYFLCDSEATESVRLAEQQSLRLVDVRVTLERLLDAALTAPATPPDAEIRPAQPGDVAALKAIARGCHTDSRFYADPGFERRRCDALYETWIERSCAGWAEVVLTGVEGGAPIGYVSCHRDGAELGRIGLVGVADAVRGRGWGRRLVHAALAWCAAAGVTRVSVVTQGRNIAAQRLYQRCGFTTRAVQLWYHGWKPFRQESERP